MFTPQKKLWSLLRSEVGQENGSISGPGSEWNSNSKISRKNKDVDVCENDGANEQELLVNKVLKLENELFEYQYNMGLLLIEKKEWNMKYEEFKHASAEVDESLKRERAAHSIAIAEVEKREENLKKALGTERQCVLDLEKDLREIRTQYAEIKFNTKSKLAEAIALAAGAEEKSLEVEKQVHVADAKLAEVSRKSSELERKLRDMETQENTLRRERFFFAAERETQETALSKQREDLREWENKLKGGEERLVDCRRLLNQREERVNEKDKITKEKQNDLEQLQKIIEMENSTLKMKEEDISSRIAGLALKEKEADVVGKNLEMKEKQLLEWQKKLNTREELEMEKHLDEHKAILEEKQKKFELEMDHKRKLHDEQLKSKAVEVEKKEAEIIRMEEKVKKRDQAIEKKLEKLREKEMDLDSRFKVLEEREKSFKFDEKSLEKDREQMHTEKEDLFNVKADLEYLRADVEKQQLKLKEEHEQLKVTEDERLEHRRLQSELERELDKWRLQNEQLLKETDDLKQEKEKFEKEWEQLDDRRADITKELTDVLEKKKNFEKLRQSEEEMLNNKKIEIQQYVQRELEALKLAKDSFAASMEHEKLTLVEKYKSDESKLLYDFELQKQEFETEMLRRQEEMETHLHDKEKLFKEESKAELNNVTCLREVARRQMEEIKLERNGNEKDKIEISHLKKQVEAQHSEMKKDLMDLIGLSQKLKDQRGQLVKERERFLTFVDKQKNCGICGDSVHEYILSNLNSLTALENFEAPPLPVVAENYLKEPVEGTSVWLINALPPFPINSGSPATDGTMSWFRKCTSKIFKFSPGKKPEPASAVDAIIKHMDMDSPNILRSTENGPEILQVADDSCNVEIMLSKSGTREDEANQALSSNHNPEDVPANSQNSDAKTHSHGPGRNVRPGPTRTRSVKAVIEGGSSFLGQSTKENEIWCVNGCVSESDLFKTQKKRIKRNHMLISQETASNDRHNAGHFDGEHRKKQQRVSATEQKFVEKRYNLRTPKILGATLANGSLHESRKRRKGKTASGKKGKDDRLPGIMASSSEMVEGVGASTDEIHEPGTGVTLSEGFHGSDGDEPVRSTEAASEFSADSPLKTQGDNHEENMDTTNTFTNDMDLIEENITAGCENLEIDNDDGDEVNHPGEVSIRKKIWTFLTM
ncbi:nuclear matrix constituent protein 1-like isoform X1 [Primulina tabacum]|uniref:nuclear matrix constituent protein 1-like isoform X1 n=1 Tax=Primulina tabacum TaxID=48773 RepID=UPI003F591910